MDSHRPLEITHEDFKSVYLEDWKKLHAEAEEILKEAEKLRDDGQISEYLHAMQRYDTYIASADTMLAVAAKFPVAEA